MFPVKERHKIEIKEIKKFIVNVRIDPAAQHLFSGENDGLRGLFLRVKVVSRVDNCKWLDSSTLFTQQQLKNKVNK